MLARSFIGFWSSGENNTFSEAMFDALQSEVNGSKRYKKGKYDIIVSEDCNVTVSDDFLTLNTSRKDNVDSLFMMISLELSDKFLKIERDLWGTRILNYLHVSRGIYFSTDIRYLLALPIHGICEYDCTALMESSTLGYIHSEDRTLFKKIKQLPRNSSLIFDGEKFQIEKKIIYFDDEKFDNLETASSEFKNAFSATCSNAARILGNKAYPLSGGMDSTAIVLESSEYLNQIHSFSFSSLCNQEDVYYAEKIAEITASKHTVISFDEKNAVLKLPAFFNAVENVEFTGIFSSFGGYAYYLMCEKIRNEGFDVIFPGEGADELFGGYYWQLTHTFGFVDNLKKITYGTKMYDEILNLFPAVEDRDIYRKIAYNFLQGSALTNYHLSCIEHSVKAFGLYNYPIYMMPRIYEVLRKVPLKWLCDGTTTKILLRKYLLEKLEKIGLFGLVTRKKMAMPSVLPTSFKNIINALAKKESRCSQNPYKNILRQNSLNIMMLDLFHKYYTTRPLESVDLIEWKEDLEKLERNERIIHW